MTSPAGNLHSGGSSSILRKQRKSKKQSSTAKKQLDQIPPSFYIDAEEALEAGIQLEEKAERFAIGEKAIKYYSLAFQVYQRALQLRNGNDPDAAYNAARISYILGTIFSLPPLSLNNLRESIGSYTKSLNLSEPISKIDGSPNAFYLDVQFNLASAQSSLAEQKQRIGEEDREIQILLKECIGNYQSVLHGQEAVLKKQLEIEAENVSADIERAPLVAQEDEGDDYSQDEVPIDADQNIRSEYTTSLITPASALETIASLHAAFLVILDSNLIDDEAKEILNLAFHNLTRAESIFQIFPDGERRSPENEWNEQVEGLRFTSLELQIANLNANIQQTQIQDLTALGQQVLQSSSDLLDPTTTLNSFDMTTTNGRANQKIHVQKLEQLGEINLHFARILIGIIRKMQSVDSIQDLVRLAWQLCTQSSKLFLATISALDASSSSSSSSTAGSGTMTSSVVLGSAHSFNPSMRRRASNYTSLSLISVLRSDDLFTASSIISGVDVKTCFTLLDNARVYARKALAELGLTWLLQQSKSTFQSSRYSIPHGGLDSLSVDVEAVLALFRALVRRMVVLTGDNAQQAQNETELLTRNIKEIVSMRKDEVGAVWKACLNLTPSSVNSNTSPQLLNQIIGEEGESNFTLQEMQIWSTIQQELIIIEN